jgi:hypothetical protein
VNGTPKMFPYSGWKKPDAGFAGIQSSERIGDSHSFFWRTSVIVND